MKQPRIALSIALVAILAIGGVLLFSPKARPGTTTPPIAWMPDHIVVTLAPGESKTVQATAIIKNSIPATAAQFVPSLAPYVSVSPSSSPALSKGSQRQFEVLVSVPSDAPPATIEGTLHLRSGSSTIARPLKIRLNIWTRILIPDGGVTLNYPPRLFLPSVPLDFDEDGLGFFEAETAYLEGLPPLFNITKDQVVTGTALVEWIQSFGVLAAQISTVRIGDRDYLKWAEDNGEGASVVSYSRLLDAEHVLTFTAASSLFAESQEFLDIIASFGS